MTEYTITLARSGGEMSDDDYARITLQVHVDGAELRITEMVIRPGSRGDLTSQDVPPVDLHLLAQAFLLAPVAAPAGTPDVKLPKVPVPTRASNDKSPSTTAKRSTGARPYRHMPEPAQVLKVLREAGTVTEMAKRFGVPRHTAQGWLARIRAAESRG